MSIKMENLVQQWEEFECFLSMFPEEEEISYDSKMKEAYQEYVFAQDPSKQFPSIPFKYTIHLKVRYCHHVSAVYVLYVPKQ
jgi:lysyl-tRNA synthetase class I